MVKPTNASEAKAFIRSAVADPTGAWDQIASWAGDEDWRTREVAASALVAIARRHPVEAVARARQWATDDDANLRRAASEGLRGLARTDFAAVLPVLDRLRGDPALYVRKSVANLLRDGSRDAPDLVLSTCERWSRNATPETSWVVRNGLKKVATSARAIEILERLANRTRTQAPGSRATRPSTSSRASVGARGSIRSMRGRTKAARHRGRVPCAACDPVSMWASLSCARARPHRASVGRGRSR